MPLLKIYQVVMVTLRINLMTLDLCNNHIVQLKIYVIMKVVYFYALQESTSGPD